MAEQVTLADVARWAGVSLATASRALHGSAGRTVRPELRARVMAAAAELNYSANANARAIARGRSATVGLIVHDIADPSAATIAAGVMAAAAERGLIVTIGSSMSDPDTEIAHVEALRQQRARAIILAGSRFADPDRHAQLSVELGAFRLGGGGLAVIGQDRLGVNAIVVDNAGGAARLATALVGLGYRRPAVLCGPDVLVSSEDRVAGFRAGLADAGVDLPGENVLEAPLTRDGGYVAVTELLDREIDLDVVFAVTDVMAVGAIAALREQGHRVPEDIALAGFDDIPTLRDVRPALTTVRLPLTEIGRRAVGLAIDLNPDPEAGAPAVVTVNPEVVIRDSTPPRG